MISQRVKQHICKTRKPKLKPILSKECILYHPKMKNKILMNFANETK